MKLHPQCRCQCGFVLDIEVTGTQSIPDQICPACGSVMWSIDEAVASNRIFARSADEFHKKGDFTLTIVLSAMAVEAELARVFMKWKRIEWMDQTTSACGDEWKWEEELRKWTAVARKFDGISEFLTQEPFDTFLRNHSKLADKVHRRHPIVRSHSSPRDFFQEQLFWKRNRIVHFGILDFEEADAYQCVELASTLFLIISEMDAVRQKRLHDALETP